MFAAMFKLVRIAVFAAVGVVAAAAATEPGAPSVLTQAVAATEAAKADYAFDIDLQTSKQTWRARFDPNDSPRLHLVEPRREDLDHDERRAFDRLAQDMEGVSWCAGESMGHVADVRVLREDATTATYAFQPTPASIRGEQARQFAQRLRGEFTLVKADNDIVGVRLFTPEAFSPLPLVRVDRVNVNISCQTAPNGRRYAAETVTELRGSAFGQDFNERSVQHARNLAAP